jgi:8-oxo-dGTP pyrophosphatase MutT (NUDIX family)
MAGVARLARTKRKKRPATIRRARVVTVAPSGRVAMIERYVNGRTFLSVPGGRLEPGETPEQAALREIKEELGLRVTLAGRLIDLDQQAYFLAVVPEESPLVLSGPELRQASARNRYTPRWVDGATLDGLPLRQNQIRPLLTAAVLAVTATLSATSAPVRVPPEEVLLDLPTADSPVPDLRPEAAAGYPRPLRRRFVFRLRATGPDHRERLPA